jgi:hypothetical protein
VPPDNHETIPARDGSWVCRNHNCEFVGDHPDAILHVILYQFTAARGDV